MGDVLSVGVVGAGGIARSHMNAMGSCDTIRLAAVMDLYPEPAESAAKEFGGKAYADLDSMLADPEVEAVHVCTPHNQHGEQVVAAAKAGKHVLVEKPMALTLEACDQMIAACEDAGKVLMVGQVMRYYPISKKVKSLIAEGEIGDVGHLLRRRISYFNPSGGGANNAHWYLNLEVGGVCVLYCFGPHEYDLLHWYMDSPIVKVYAQGNESTSLYEGQKDSYTSVMNHENGAVSVLSQSVVSHTSAHDQFIMGSRGSMMLNHQKLLLNGEEVEIAGTTKEGMPNQIREFADCCLTGRTPDANGRSVRHTMAVIEASKQSAERDEAVMVSEFE